MTLLVVATKLFSPFDTVDRHPAAADEPALASIDWTAWNRLYPQPRRWQEYEPPNEQTRFMDLTTDNVMEASTNVLDNYMDWFQRSFAEEEVDDRDRDAPFRRAMLQMFPVDNTPLSRDGSAEASAPVHDQLHAVQASLKVHRVVEEEEDGATIRPGMRYKHYRNEADLPDMARRFFEVVADIVALPLSDMVKAVFRMERKLEKQVERRRSQSDENTILD